MKKLSESHINHLKSHLPGRLTLNLYEKISGKYGIAPTNNQVVEFLDEYSKINHGLFYYFYSFFQKNNFIPIDFNELEFPSSITATLKKLEDFPLSESIFFYLNNCKDVIGEDELVVWIECSELKAPSDGHFYTIIITHEGGPEEIIGFFEIRTSQTHPEPAFTFLGGDSVLTKSLDEDINEPMLAISLSILNYIANKPYDIFLNDYDKIRELKGDSKLEPPTDKVLLEKMKEVYRGEQKCIKCEVDQKYIVPFDYSFCLDYPERYIFEAIKYLDKVVEFGIVTYQENDRLIMSDNYSSYLALRKEKHEKITVINIGEITLPHKRIIEGGKELLPPLFNSFSTNINSLPIDLKDELLEQKLNKLKTFEKIERIKRNNHQEIKEKILNNNLNESLNELISITVNKHIQDELILMKSRLTKLNSDLRKGLLSHEQETLSFNRLRNDILEIINEI
ncbi:MAG: hypothetical protein P1U56_20055 [Saprospiraceae bacterium]|nr:hypothetical protein [Saprospiraceae bacterium]